MVLKFVPELVLEFLLKFLQTESLAKNLMPLPLALLP